MTDLHDIICVMVVKLRTCCTCNTVFSISIEHCSEPLILYVSMYTTLMEPTLIIRMQYRNSGQTCVCTNRMIVHEAVAAEFASKLAAKAAKLVVGSGHDASTNQVTDS